MRFRVGRMGEALFNVRGFINAQMGIALARATT